jgi:hypothetical protein
LRALRSRTSGPRVARSWTSDAGTLALGAIVTPRHKLIMDATARRLALYDLGSDPHESRDLSTANPARARKLARRLRATNEDPVRTAAPPPVADDTAQKLRALGYTQ